MKTLVVKQLQDGTRRVCIHWLIRDEKGSIELGDTPTIPTPYLNSGIRARIACDPRQNKVTPLHRGNETLLCLRSDDVRAVTCPKCLATEEAKAELAHYAEMEETPMSEENLRLLQGAVQSTQELAETVEAV